MQRDFVASMARAVGVDGIIVALRADYSCHADPPGGAINFVFKVKDTKFIRIGNVE